MTQTAPLAEMDLVRHAFCGRAGGVSEGIFASLNCGFGSGDDPAKVMENRARAAALAGVDPAGIRQITQNRRDTCAEAEAFFSYRRNTLQGEKGYGRNISMIALEG